MADSIGASSAPDSETLRGAEPLKLSGGLTGEVSPKPEEASPEAAPAESAPAPSRDAAPSTEGLENEASEASTPQKPKSKVAQRTEELDTEIAGLHERLAERARLRQQLAAPEPERQRTTDEKPAATSTATPSLQQLLDRPDLSRPPLGDTEFFGAYPDASVSDLVAYRSRYEWAQQSRVGAIQAQRDGRLHAFVERRDKAIAEDPTFRESLDRRIDALVPVDLMPAGQIAGPLNVIAQEIYESEHSVALMRHLSANPKELDAMQTMGPREIVRAIGRLEAKVSVVPPQPVVKTTTSAPKPASVSLGTRNSAPADPANAALAQKDFRRYMAEKNRQEGAS